MRRGCYDEVLFPQLAKASRVDWFLETIISESVNLVRSLVAVVLGFSKSSITVSISGVGQKVFVGGVVVEFAVLDSSVGKVVVGIVDMIGGSVMGGGGVVLLFVGVVSFSVGRGGVVAMGL